MKKAIQILLILLLLPCRARAHDRWTVALRTDLASDLLLTPSLGVEAGCRHVSFAADWAFAHWGGDSRCWRVSLGEFEARYWLHTEASAWTGHHFGIFAMAMSYDIKLGKIGRQNNGPTWGVGISYGYSFPIARRLRIDLSAGVGYLDASYTRYRRECGLNVFEGNRHRHYFGPLKGEVSLVWLLHQ